MKALLKNQNTKSIFIFIALTFLLTYGLEIGVIWNSLESPLLQPLIASVMFIPSIAMVLTRLITKEGFKNLYLKIHLKGHIRYYLLAWFGTASLIGIGCLTYFLLFPHQFDGNLPLMAQALAATGGTPTTSQLQVSLLMQVLTGIFLAPILNLLPCLGEEWAWRGYLLPKLSQTHKLIPTILLNGLIWGLWHAPLTIIGHNYGMGYWGYPWTGIAAMCLFCIIIGTFLSYLTYRTKSIWPAVIAHGSLNGLAATGVYLTGNGGNPFIGPAPTGVIGGIGFILMAVFVVIALSKNPVCFSDTEN